MNDTRLIQIAEHLRAARELIAELCEENIGPYTAVDLGHADIRLRDAQSYVRRVM